MAEYLTRARAVVCTSEQIIVVHGSQQALALAGDVLLDPGDRVLIEEPGYPGAALSFLAAGATLVPGRVGPEGLDVRTLGKSVQRVRKRAQARSTKFRDRRRWSPCVGERPRSRSAATLLRRHDGERLQP